MIYNLIQRRLIVYHLTYGICSFYSHGWGWLSSRINVDRACRGYSALNCRALLIDFYLSSAHAFDGLGFGSVSFDKTHGDTQISCR